MTPIRPICWFTAAMLALVSTAPLAQEERTRDEGRPHERGSSGIGIGTGIGLGIGILQGLTSQPAGGGVQQTQTRQPKRAARKDDKTGQPKRAARRDDKTVVKKPPPEERPKLTKPPCDYAIGYFWGGVEHKSKYEEEDLAFAISTSDALRKALVDGWGFPDTRGNIRFVKNGNVTRKEIERNFKTLNEQLSEKAAGDDCYVKLHFMGHGFKWKPGDDRQKNQTPQKDADKPHIGFEVSPDPEADNSKEGNPEDVYWDYELVDQLNKISDLLKKKGKKSALIVQADFCWAQGIFADLAAKPASNMYLAWSAAKDKELCQKPTPEQPTPFTQGFIDAFQNGANPTIQDAHKGATQSTQLKDMNPGTVSGSSDGVSPKK